MSVNEVKLKEVDIYSDGAAVPNPGCGGWGAMLLYTVSGKQFRKELYGGFRHTTNNRMELVSIIKGISALKEPCSINLYSDCQRAEFLRLLQSF